MRIGLTTVGTPGDVRPFVALALRLREAGHDVRASSWAMYASEFESREIPFRPVGPAVSSDRIRDVAERAAAARNPFEQLRILRDFHLDDSERHYVDVRDATADLDVAVCHAIHTIGQAAVMDNGVPWIGVTFDPLLLPTSRRAPPPLPSVAPPVNRFFWRMLERSLARQDRPLTAVLERGGSEQSEMRMFRTRSRLLNIVACAEEITGEYPDLPPNFAFTAPWFLDEPDYRPPSDLVDFLEGGSPPVVVTFGSMAGGEGRTLGAVVSNAVRAAGMRAVVQRGLADLEGIAEGGDVLTVGHVPHRYLFGAASCVVHHGGAGTTAAACAAGVPSVVVPHVGDQIYWAGQLHRLGVAPAPVPLRDLTAERLASRLREVAASAEVRSRARALGERISARDGVAEAVEIIERVAVPHAAAADEARAGA